MSEFIDELHLSQLQNTLLTGNIGLQGPTHAFTDAIDEAEIAATEHVRQEWTRISTVIDTISTALGHEVATEPQQLPEPFLDSLKQHARQIIVAYGRAHGDMPDSQDVIRTIPLITEEFCAINGLLGFTSSDYKKKRHPAMIMSSEQMRQFIATASETGFTGSYIKTLACKRNPWTALEEAREKLQAIREADTVNGSIGSEMRLAIGRKDPLSTIRSRDRLATRLLARYEGDCVVKPADVRDAIDAHTIDDVEQALRDFRNKVLHLLVEHAGDPLIDLHTIRAVCRRTGDPDKQIEIIRQRYAALTIAEPELSENIAKYLARHYADPQATLVNARRLIAGSPKLTARFAVSPKNTLWETIQRANQHATASTPQ